MLLSDNCSAGLSIDRRVVASVVAFLWKLKRCPGVQGFVVEVRSLGEVFVAEDRVAR